ncbi:hypothetical protein ACHHYP_08208 [Achlya hypogyna]|uniref:Tetratricopeptide repeat protein n=1 Tax=Achlya hypogyna TaxID=1202772 RepID=A0A1V9ZL54_ACHHY|nr:hypothetical protein ACHHYP_08208 [Achlya hypogyna]
MMMSRATPRLLGRTCVRCMHQGQHQSYEALRADFQQWLRKEIKLVSLFLATGLSVIFAYAYRDDAPVRQMHHVLAEATVAAKGGDKYRARQLTQRAYAIAGSVSEREPHLYELAFSIAAQFEAAGQYDQAKKFYHEAMTHVVHAKHANKHLAMYRLVTLDRIAQCCHNLGDAAGAAVYYKRALDLYEKERGSSRFRDQMDAEVCGVWFNYARLCLDNRQVVHGSALLESAAKCAHENDLPDEKLAEIEALAADLAEIPSPTFADIVGTRNTDD